MGYQNIPMRIYPKDITTEYSNLGPLPISTGFPRGMTDGLRIAL
jgi:hypothetical protein